MDKVPGQKQSSASSPCESKNQPSGSAASATAKPAGKASAAPLEAAKKGNTAKQKVTPKSTASSSKAAKTDDSSADVNARLDKLEKLLQMVVEDRQKGETSRNTDVSTRKMSNDRDDSPDRGNGGHVQYSESRGRGYDYDPNYEESDELSLGSSLSQDTDVPQVQEVPSIAAKFAIPSGVGKPLNAHLANNIEYLTTHPLDEKNIGDTGDKYVCPDNCPTLDVPKVNSTIWENLRGTTRSKDLKLQRVQRGLARGLTAFARTVDDSEHELTETQQEALALLCNAHFELSCLRKDCIRPEINPKFAHLCKATNVLTPSKQLFGDDLSKRVKDMQEEQKAAVGVVKTGKPYRERRAYRPYPEHASSSKARYHDAGWQSRASYSQPTHSQAQRPFLAPGASRNPWRKKAPHTQSHPPSSDKSNTGKGRDQSRY